MDKVFTELSIVVNAVRVKAASEGEEDQLETAHMVLFGAPDTVRTLKTLISSHAHLVQQVEQGLLTASEAEECVSSEFNPVRAGFHDNHTTWTRDVLNLGVRPDRLIAKVKLPSLRGSVLFSLQGVCWQY